MLIYTYCFFKVRTTSDKQNLRTFQRQKTGLRFIQQIGTLLPIMKPLLAETLKGVIYDFYFFSHG